MSRTPSESKTVPVATKVTESTHKRALAKCVKTGQTLSGYVANLIEKDVKNDVEAIPKPKRKLP